MTDQVSERRLAENELIFRQANQKVSQSFAHLKSSVEEGKDGDWLPDLEATIHFFCECSDEKCRQRIKLKQSKYEELHQNGSQFVLLPGHNHPKVERVMQSTDDYIVVEKYIAPPPSGKKLNLTDLQNSSK